MKMFGISWSLVRLLDASTAPIRVVEAAPTSLQVSAARPMPTPDNGSNGRPKTRRHRHHKMRCRNQPSGVVEGLCPTPPDWQVLNLGRRTF